MRVAVRLRASLRLVALAATPLLLAACAKSTPPPRADYPVRQPVTATIVDAGGLVTEHKPDRVPAPDTAQGSVGEVDEYWTPKFTSPPDQVKAKVGTSIGIEVRVEGPPFLEVVPLRTRVTHPPITDPNTGKTTTVDEWDNPMNSRFPRYTGWGFDNPWEVVPGTWKIEVLHEGKVIAGQEFQVTIDEGAPAS